jgi:hypothetical protein
MGGCGAKVLGRPCRSWVKVGSGEPFAESPSTPMNGHHQSGPAGPFRANERNRSRGRGCGVGRGRASNGWTMGACCLTMKGRKHIPRTDDRSAR